MNALVPVDNLNVLHGFKRVYGVGVDAVINAKLESTGFGPISLYRLRREPRFVSHWVGF